MHKETIQRIRPWKSSEPCAAMPAILHEVTDRVSSSVPTGVGHHFSSIPILSQPIQAKLEISQPGDPLEQEADLIADQVMRSNDREVRTSDIVPGVRYVQRECAECEKEEKEQGEEFRYLQRKCAECDEEEQRQKTEGTNLAKVQLQAAGSRVEAEGLAGARSAPELSSGGAPLDTAVRQSMEPNFGHDFSQVRIHADNEAAKSAREFNARAYTLGSHIVFAAGEYDPLGTTGKRLLAHELTHVVQQRAAAPASFVSKPADPAEQEASNASEQIAKEQVPSSFLNAHGTAVIHRDPPPSAPAPPATATVDPNPLEEQEKKAFDAASQRVGQRAATVHFRSANQEATSGVDNEDFLIESVIKRPANDSNRLGFDNEGAAKAFASMQAAGSGAIAIKQDAFYFAARLSKGKHLLRATDVSFWKEKPEVKDALLALVWAPALTSKINADWFSRPSVYQVNPAADVLAVYGTDGFGFPLNQVIEPEAATAAKQAEPSIAKPPDAQDLRAIAGIVPEGKDPANAPKMPDAMDMTPQQQDAFINSYVRARGLEALDSNEQAVDKLAQDFAPTTSGTKQQAGSGVSAKAKRLIDDSRMLGRFYYTILEDEAKLQAEVVRIDTWLQHGEAGGNDTYSDRAKRPITSRGQSKIASEWLKELKDKQQALATQKNNFLSLSPLLAQLVERQDPKDRAPLGTVMPNNPYDQSLLNAPSTPENDEKIRGTFAAKLDDVRKAIRHTRAELIGSDLETLFTWKGLRERVRGDFMRMTGKNAGMSDRFKDLVQKAHDSEEVFNGVATVIQIGLLFVPGGQFISGAIGFSMAAEGMNEHMKEWDASKAAVDPASALADQQEAERKMIADTEALAWSALDLAAGVNEALDFSEGNAGPGKAGKPGEPGHAEAEVRDHGQFHDDVTGEVHDWRITEHGMEVCSPSCPVIGKDIEGRAGKIEADHTAAGLTLEPDVSAELTRLKAAAAASDAKAIALEADLKKVNQEIEQARNAKKLPPEDVRERKADLERKDQELANGVKAIKEHMSGLEREQNARLKLQAEGYTENVFGTTDKEMQQAWGGGISPDMIKRNPSTGKVVIGEGKGEDFGHAVEQCERAYDQLMSKGAPIVDPAKPPGDVGRITKTVKVQAADIEIRVYVSQETYTKMRNGETIGTSKWGMDGGGNLLLDGNPYLVSKDKLPVKVLGP